MTASSKWRRACSGSPLMWSSFGQKASRSKMHCDICVNGRAVEARARATIRSASAGRPLASRRRAWLASSLICAGQAQLPWPRWCCSHLPVQAAA